MGQPSTRVEQLLAVGATFFLLMPITGGHGGASTLRLYLLTQKRRRLSIVKRAQAESPLELGLLRSANETFETMTGLIRAGGYRQRLRALCWFVNQEWQQCVVASCTHLAVLPLCERHEPFQPPQSLSLFKITYTVFQEFRTNFGRFD